MILAPVDCLDIAQSQVKEVCLARRHFDRLSLHKLDRSLSIPCGTTNFDPKSNNEVVGFLEVKLQSQLSLLLSVFCDRIRLLLIEKLGLLLYFSSKRP